MHDIKAIRETPEAYDRGWTSRGLEPQTARLLELDAALRGAQGLVQDAQSRRNDSSKLIGQAKAQKNEDLARRLMGEVENLRASIADNTAAETQIRGQLNDLLAALPNIPADDVPPGEDETGNVEQRRWTGPAVLPAHGLNAPKDHVDLGASLGGMDFEAAARMSGSRFVVLKSGIARLERAIGQYMLDLQIEENGYTEIAPPLLVRDEALYGTGQLPKFAEDLFHTTEGRWLIPTAEVSLTNIVREQIIAEEALPMRLTALTHCFRSEAGAAGRDTRGMIRQHQFQKVELVSITAPEASQEEHERMTACAGMVLEKLGLTYRTMLLCVGDMGFGARKTYDLEVWLPSQDAFREISSCSNCGDFQARRMDARTKSAGEKGTRFVHTLNGSGLAVGRTLVAVLENYQDVGGTVFIPEVLQPYMGGKTHLEPARG
ncbi:serine--tRNA ligase [soil metagenome]